jgi:16S rRNA processing protein RimM
MNENLKYEIKVGEITGAHGIKGFIKVEPLTDNPLGRFAVGNKLWLEKPNKEFEVESMQIHKGLMLLKFKGIDDRDSAHALLHTYIKIDKSALAKLPEGHYYHFDLIGLNVYEGEEYLGQVVDIFTTGANDIYVVKKDENTKEILLPALKSIVQKIDVAAGRVDVVLPEGLRD